MLQNKRKQERDTYLDSLTNRCCATCFAYDQHAILISYIIYIISYYQSMDDYILISLNWVFTFCFNMYDFKFV